MVNAKGVSSVEKNHPVKMTRPDLDNLPKHTLPAGFALRWYQDGDEAHWRRIHLAADHFNNITPELFQEQFAVGEERELQPSSRRDRRDGLKTALLDLSKRQCYLLTATGEVIGTGTAWFNNNFAGTRWGRVHWMAVLPEYQGWGLGKALLSAICNRLRELGHQRAYLTTSTARVPAIRLYLKFGFEPLIRNAEDENLWREIAR
jgi:GNAT superfamily N-acetyltransferase